jgi:hypothetical protein
MATYCYLTNRMTSLPLTTDRKETEWQKIPRHSRKQQILRTSHNKIKKKHATQNQHRQNGQQNQKKGATFTYHSQKDRKITNLFKQTDIKIAFRSTNTIQQQTRPKNHETTPDHNKSGIYKLLCKTCNKAYIGQTSHNLSFTFSRLMTHIYVVPHR